MVSSNCLEDQAPWRTDTWLICPWWSLLSPNWGLWDPFQMAEMAYKFWLYTNYLLTGMILQVGATADDPLLSEVFSCLGKGKKVTRIRKNITSQWKFVWCCKCLGWKSIAIFRTFSNFTSFVPPKPPQKKDPLKKRVSVQPIGWVKN